MGRLLLLTADRSGSSLLQWYVDLLGAPENLVYRDPKLRRRRSWLKSSRGRRRGRPAGRRGRQQTVAAGTATCTGRGGDRYRLLGQVDLLGEKSKNNGLKSEVSRYKYLYGLY